MYQVRLIDKNGNWIYETFEETKKAAIAKAKYLLSDNWAEDSETTHERLETEKVEVHNVLVRTGISCIWDKFLQ